MNKNQEIVQTLKEQGWTCKKCNCRSSGGYDCLHSQYAGMMIQVTATGFVKMRKKGLLVFSGRLTELTKKLDVLQEKK